MDLPEDTLPVLGALPVPALPREAWSQVEKRGGFRSRRFQGSRTTSTEVLAVEPLYAFCVLDPFLRFVQVSPVIAELTGYTVNELCCMGLQEIIALESMEATLAAFEHVDALDWSHHTAKLYRKDGVPAEVRMDAIRVSEDQYLGWIREIRVKAGSPLTVRP
nr:PAS domain-containing protein [uncultured Holophaga sp.]